MTPRHDEAPLLEIEGLFKTFDLGGGLFSRSKRRIHAVNDVTLAIHAGTTLGLVGESGSGKSTLARLLVRLETPTAGDIRFDGRSILDVRGEALQEFRRSVQMVFQDPFASLNPRMDVASLIGEAWIVHPALKPAQPRTRIAELMEQVGLRPEWSNRFPGQFSGGQRQRIGIARALAVGPKLLVCDEAVSALDVSVQAQILMLLQRIQRELGVTYLFISHDLSVIRHVSDAVAVMQLGRIVEQGPADTLYERPLHPYTQALLAAVPRIEPKAQQRERPRLRGDVPDPSAPPSGCMFRTRCWRAEPRCAETRPPLDAVGADHFVACVSPGEWRPDRAGHSACASQASEDGV